MSNLCRLASALAQYKQSPVLILALWNELLVGMLPDDAFSGHQNLCWMIEDSYAVNITLTFLTGIVHVV